MQKPAIKPNCPNFSSGPCAKRPGWSLENLGNAVLGRSHRSSLGKARLKDVIDHHKDILEIPGDYLVGIVPASDTGAVEMAMWSMLGARGVDMFAWESFSSTWLKDVKDQLKLDDARFFEAEYGQLPDMTQYDSSRDCVFVWNGTTSGVRVPDAHWIPAKREGLTICDATSAVFAYEMPWDKLDVTTWSWQKVLGGEAAHGMIVLSPRAVERLENYTPPWPMPKIFRMTKGGKINTGIFEGSTINTPSMLAVEDCIDALNWVQEIGDVQATIKRTDDNFRAIKRWIDGSEIFDFLAAHAETRSKTSICIKISDPWFESLPEDQRPALVKRIVKLLDEEGVGYDLGHYRDAPAGFRIWGGATVETRDIEALLPWIDWAYGTIKATTVKI